jgi:hypothetical protein
MAGGPFELRREAFQAEHPLSDFRWTVSDGHWSAVPARPAPSVATWQARRSRTSKCRAQVSGTDFGKQKRGQVSLIGDSEETKKPTP